MILFLGGRGWREGGKERGEEEEREGGMEGISKDSRKGGKEGGRSEE